MAKKNVKITQKQENGTLLELYPITRAGNVEELLTTFTSSRAYEVGDIVVSEGNIYKCKAAYTSSSTTPGSDTTHWDLVTSGHNQTVKGAGTAFGADDEVNIVGGSNVTVTPNTTDKTITISATNTNTSHNHSAGVGLVGSGSAGTSGGTYTYKAALVNEALSANASSYTAGGSSKFYSVQLDKDGKLATYVPWENTNTWRAVKLNGVQKLDNSTSGNALDLVAGSNISITESGGAFTIGVTGLSSAMQFVGVSTTDPSSAGATVSGHTSWAKGEVVIYKRTGESGYEEYINLDGSNVAASWELLGDADSYALKTTTITGTGALAGGGDLTQNRTITHNKQSAFTNNPKTTDDIIYSAKIDEYGHWTGAEEKFSAEDSNGKLYLRPYAGGDLDSDLTISSTDQENDITMDSYGISISADKYGSGASKRVSIDATSGNGQGTSHSASILAATSTGDSSIQMQAGSIYITANDDDYLNLVSIDGNINVGTGHTLTLKAPMSGSSSDVGGLVLSAPATIPGSVATDITLTLPTDEGTLVETANANTLTDNQIILGNGNKKVKASGKTISTAAPTASSTDNTIPTSKAVGTVLDGKLTATTAKVQLTGDVTSSAVSLTNGTASVATTLANSGVTAGTYSAVSVNAKGIVTAGAQMIEVGTAGQTTPSASLAVGGIFYMDMASS